LLREVVESATELMQELLPIAGGLLLPRLIADRSPDERCASGRRA